MDTSVTRLTRRSFLRLGLQVGAAAALLRAVPESASAARPPRPSLDEKIGQMIMAGFNGYTLKEHEPVYADLTERYVGSTCLFDFDVETWKYKRNVKSPKQVADLNAELQEATPRPPLLITVDQEGGRVARLKESYGFPPSFTQQFLGTQNDLSFTHECAHTTAETLKQVGINMNLAPVVDLNVNPECPIIGAYERSFSADPDIVTGHALEVIQAHHETGILTTLKHFPGHGSSTADSHVGFVDVSDTWSEIELEPFRNIIQLGKADMVMTAHIFNTHLDPDYPATLSQPTITGILREQLGFDGVVCTDDMGMGAIADNFGLETAVTLSIQAGVDLLAFALNSKVNDLTVPARVFQHIKNMVETGVIPESRIDQSYQRILRLKDGIPQIGCQHSMTV